MSSKKKVAYLGPGKDSFGFQALIKYFRGWKVDPIASVSHADICCKVGKMQVDFGVVAVENVIDGVVSETVRSVEYADAQFGVKICGEEGVSIDMRLLAQKGVKLDELKRLASHRVAINQCSKIVHELQAKGIEIIVSNSTSEAVAMARSYKSIGALASLDVLKLFEKLQDLGGQNMIDYANSQTRFWVLSKQHARFVSDKHFRTCFLVNFDHSSVGAMHKTLKLFADRNINVVLIHPSPIRGKEWEYTFVIEVECHISDERMNGLWDEFCMLGISLQPLRFLGSYETKTLKRR